MPVALFMLCMTFALICFVLAYNLIEDMFSDLPSFVWLIVLSNASVVLLWVAIARLLVPAHRFIVGV